MGKLSVSEDYGETFRYARIPAMVHGNLSGRGTGQRLVVDPGDSDTLYFASSKDGLLRTGTGDRTGRSSRCRRNT